MQKVNDLFGKQVINQSNGRRESTVRDVVLNNDGQRIVALVVGDGGWSNDEQVIHWEAIRAVGDYVIVEGLQPFASLDEDPEVVDLRKQARVEKQFATADTIRDQLKTLGISLEDRPEGTVYRVE